MCPIREPKPRQSLVATQRPLAGHIVQHLNPFLDRHLHEVRSYGCERALISQAHWRFSRVAGRDRSVIWGTDRPATPLFELSRPDRKSGFQERSRATAGRRQLSSRPLQRPRSRPPGPRPAPRCRAGRHTRTVRPPTTDTGLSMLNPTRTRRPWSSRARATGNHGSATRTGSGSADSIAASKTADTVSPLPSLSAITSPAASPRSGSSCRRPPTRGLSRPAATPPSTRRPCAPRAWPSAFRWPGPTPGPCRQRRPTRGPSRPAATPPSPPRARAPRAWPSAFRWPGSTPGSSCQRRPTRGPSRLAALPPRHRPHAARVPLELGRLLSGGRGPHPDRLVNAGRREGLPVRPPRHRAHPVLVPLELGRLLSGGRVPHPDRLVAAARREGFPVRPPRHRDHPFLVPLELGRLLSGGRVPHPDRLVDAARREGFPVRPPRHRDHPFLVPLELGRLLSGGRVPHPDRLV